MSRLLALPQPLALTGDEAANLTDFTRRYGVLHWTREPAPDCRFRRLWPVAIPLVEEFDRRTVAHLKFWRLCAEAERGR